MKFNDVLGLGKILPLDKLLQVIEKMTGRVTKHYFDKKDVDAKAYEIKTLAEARAVEMKIISDAVKENHINTAGIEYKEEKLQIHSPSISAAIKELPSIDLEDRTKERLLYQQAKKQINIENIMAIAAEQLKEEPAIDDDPVDEDWLNRFFNIAEDISNEQLQSLWGKILAGEIQRPKSYSLRTLEIIKNLSKEEADTITKVANFAFRIGRDFFLSDGNNHVLAKYGITYYDRALLIEIGILQPGDFITYNFRANQPKNTTPIVHGNLVLIVQRDDNASEQNLPNTIYKNWYRNLKLTDHIFKSRLLKRNCFIFKTPRYPNIVRKHFSHN